MATLDVCHHEDASKPCSNPHCALHSAFTTPAVSRNHSAVDLAALQAQHLQSTPEEDEEEGAQHPNGVNGADISSEEDSTDDDDSTMLGGGGVVRRKPRGADGADADHIDPELAERQVREAAEREGMHFGEFQALPEPAREPPAQPEPSRAEEEDAVVAPVETAPHGASSLEQGDVLQHAAPAAPPVEITPPGDEEATTDQPPTDVTPPATASAVTAHAEENASTDAPPAAQPAAKEDIPDEPPAEQPPATQPETAAAGGQDADKDPFEQLREAAPERSASFPPVPPLPEQSKEPDEKSLLAMMATEAAATAGEGDRGPFDSPAADEGGLYKAEDSEGSFFDQIGQQGSTPPDGKVMGGVDVGAESQDIQQHENHEETQDARYEEGMPLIGKPDEQQEQAKKEVHFFDEDKPEEADDFFASINAKDTEPEIMPLQRKSTEQVIENQAHPYHSGSGLAASRSTVVSEVLANPAEEPAIAEETDGDDFFSQLGKAPAASEEPSQQPTADSSEDIKAKWKAALADDDFLDDDDGFLPSDDDGFLPSDDEQGLAPIATGSLRPVVSKDGVLQGFKGPSPETTGAGMYTPQAAQTPANPYTPQLPQATPYAPQQQVHVNPYAPQQPTPYQPQAPQLTQSNSGYFPQMGAQFAKQQPPSPVKKAESFVNKKVGYASPYDLPEDVVPVLKKRPSSLAQTAMPGTPGTPGFNSPMRSSSLNSVLSPPPTGGRPAPPAGPPKAKPQPQNFFEELPVAPPKPRAASAMGGRYTPTQGAPPMGPPMGAGGPPRRPDSTQGFYGSPHQQFAQPVRSQTPQLAGVAAQQMTPAMSPQQAFAQPSAAANMYPPAPQQLQRSASYQPPPAASRYSPVPAQALQYQLPPDGSAAPHPAAAVGLGLNPPPGAPAPAQPPATSKYAPRPAAPPQVPAPAQAGLYAPPPPPTQRTQSTGPVLQQGFMSPPARHQSFDGMQNLQPVHASLPDMESVLNGPPKLHHSTSAPQAQMQASPEQYPPQRRLSGEAMHSSRPGTAGTIPAGLEIPLEEEEDGSVPAKPNGHVAQQSSVSSIAQNRYALGAATPPPQSTPDGRARNFSPPMNVAQHQLSPQKARVRTASPDIYAPPPPRSQSQSPGISRTQPIRKPSGTYDRPASALAHSSTTGYVPTSAPVQRPTSLEVNFMKPNDTTADDNLERWKGKPVFTWGFGGTATVMFPKRTQRFSSDTQQMMVKVSPGEVDVRTVRDTLPLEEDVEKFPGPIWTGSKSAHKTKKKEVLTYMTERIQAMEAAESEAYDPTVRQQTHEKRMLWQVVKIMVENDGVVEGTPEVEKAVREVLIPEAVNINDDDASGFVPMGLSNMQPPNAERVDAAAVMEFRKKLLSGDREAAVWHAVDKRLWSHAFLIASICGRDLWKRVIEDFVKNEVKTLGAGSESLAVLYETLAGNWEESVDELVPPSVRKGVPTMTTSAGSEQTVEERLDKWRETLGLILSNRSPGDQAAILALGRLLVEYGRIYAGHLCYIFARQGPLGGGGALFGGAEDPTTDFALVGADHRQPLDFSRNMDAIMLSEIYELAVSLTPHAGTANPVLPHLQVFKLHHALILAENGRKTDAQKYCDSIGSAAKAWNKPSPYFHQSFFGALEDLTLRLQAAPREESASGGSGWIPKLTSDSVSNSMWGAFNKFVAGDDEPKPEPGIPPLGDASGGDPAARNGLVTSQSGVDLYGAMSSGGNVYQPTQGTFSNPTMASAAAQSYAAGRYAPATARSSIDNSRNPYEPQNQPQRTSMDSYRSYEPTAGNGSPYEPSGYQPSAPSNPYEPAHQQTPSASSFGGPGSAGFAPQSVRNSFEAPQQAGNGYEPPQQSFGYEPPSGYTPYEPDPEPEEEGEKPKKKKGIMDDDDEDDGLSAAAAKVKAREEEETKKKAAEEKKKQEEAAANGGKKGWLTGWFGGKKAEQQQGNGPIKAKLGEESSFYYDPDQKRWVNKKAGADTPVAAAPPPPPKRASTPVASSSASTPAPPPARPQSTSFDAPPHAGSAPPMAAGGLAPPAGPPRGLTPSPAPSDASAGGLTAPPPMSRSASSNAMPPKPPVPGVKPDAMEELLGGPPSGRRSTPAGGRKKKGGASRYVEVIPGQQ